MHLTACAEPTPSSASASPSKPRRLWWSRLIRLSVAALVLWFAREAGWMLFAGNVHEAIPGKLYRGGQLSGPSLETLINKYKIRTVLNVRGCCWPDNWYLDEAAVCERLGVNMEDVSFSAIHLPSRHELRLLLDVLDHAEQPIFVHCRHGADRTGIASMAATLLLDDQSFNASHRQLSLRYGHAPIGKTTVLDRFMKLYADWLTATQQEHSPRLFRHWILHEYNGGWCDAHFEKVERLSGTPRMGQALQYNVVVRNTSSTPWQFRPLKTAGHHVTFKLLNEQQNIVYEGRAGMLDAVVAPGEKIRVVLIVPPIATEGHYRLMVDMIEEGHCWFHQTGSEPWQEEMTIRE
jgi:protein tyrosine phosphatase (PTP) superfamily phosphohydrolase (DUF442 family)